MEKNSLPLVNILMPVFNGEKTIGLAIKSLLLQSYENWKLIIVNDGSRDNTSNIISAFNSDKIHVVSLQKNMGRAFARQIALEHTTGKYIAFLDADDFWHPEKLKTQVDILEANPEVDMVSCGVGSYNSDYDLLGIRTIGDNSIKTFSFRLTYPMIPASSIIKRDLCKNIKYNHKLKGAAEDIDFFGRYLDGRKYIRLNKVYYYYSEFSTLNYSKLINYHLYGIKYFSLNLFKKPIEASKKIMLTLLKITFILIILPFTGTKYLIKRRSISPDKEHIADFEKVLTFLEVTK